MRKSQSGQVINHFTNNVALVEKNFASGDEFADLISQADGELLQTKASSGSWKLLRTDLPDTNLQHVYCAAPMISRGTASKDRLGFLIPSNSRETVYYNGVAIGKNGFGLYGPGVEHFGFVGSSSEFTLLPVKVDTAMNYLKMVPQLDPSQIFRHYNAFSFQDGGNQYFFQRVSEILNVARTTPEILESPTAAKAIQDSLFEILFSAMVSGMPSSMQHQPSYSTRSRVMVMAEEFLSNHMHRDVSLAELCVATSSSARTLGYAFQEYVGTSPLRFLKTRRMNRAHRMLRDGSVSSVKEAALSCGFWELGRFAKEYRETFGESPSVTLGKVVTTSLASRSTYHS